VFFFLGNRHNYGALSKSLISPRDRYKPIARQEFES